MFFYFLHNIYIFLICCLTFISIDDTIIPINIQNEFHAKGVYIMSMIRKREYLSVLLFSLFILAVLFFHKTYNSGTYLIVKDRNSDKKWEYKLKKNEFSIGYKHSVEKTQAEELFKVNKSGDIILWETVYEDYGVGLPFLPEEGQLEVRDGKFILKMNRSFKEINMTISPIAEHYLKINNKKYMLSKLLEGQVRSINLKIKIKG